MLNCSSSCDLPGDVNRGSVVVAAGGIKKGEKGREWEEREEREEGKKERCRRGMKWSERKVIGIGNRGETLEKGKA